MKKWTIAVLLLCSVLLFAGSKKKTDKSQTVKRNEVIKIYNQGIRCVQGGKYAESNTYFKQAAEKGFANAQYNLGLNYHLGKGCDANQEEAEKWLQKAAEQGHGKAKSLLKEIHKKKPAAK